MPRFLLITRIIDNTILYLTCIAIIKTSIHFIKSKPVITLRLKHATLREVG